MTTFLSKLQTVQQNSDSLLCVGLDTDIKKIPVHLQSKKNGVLEFNKQIIEATKDFACSYKINFAFYEALAKDGWTIIEKTRALIPSNIITIADAKRGDIGNSSSYYANAILNEMEFDSITVAPYMGKDSVAPFLFSEEKGAFLLALTSNEGAKNFQYLKVGARRVFEEVIRISLKWNTKKNLGFVVGATKAQDMKSVRKLAPNVPLLIPGIGAQGGDLKNTIQYGCDKNGFNAIINASRSILYASNGNDFAEAARREAEKLRNEINIYRKKFFK